MVPIVRMINFIQYYSVLNQLSIIKLQKNQIYSMMNYKLIVIEKNKLEIAIQSKCNYFSYGLTNKN